MTSAAISNFGFVLKKATTAIGEVVNINPPAISMETFEKTNHDSTAKEFGSVGIYEVETFDITINYLPATDAILADVIAGTSASYSITWPDTGETLWTFTATPTNFKPEGAAANSPDGLQAVVTFRPSGAKS